MDPVPLVATFGLPVVLLAATVLARRLGHTTPYRIALPLSLLAGIAAGTALDGIDPDTGLRTSIVLGFATAIGFVHYLDSPGGEWATTVRGRLLLGVPWGSFVSITLVLAVYLFLQGGLEHPYEPLTLPFTSWSYRYPLGVVTAPFSHGSLGHVTGNLIGTLALAPVAEYAWNHFPTRRGDQSFSSWRTNPYVRAFVLFPIGVVLVGLASSAFAWGAVIGFSGVVFAFAGFAVVRYPILTVVALTARGAIATVYYALRNPVVVGSASPSFGPPWWVGIAVQGHLLGLLLGAVLGVIIVGHRRNLPSAGRLFTGIVILGFSLTLYAIWWYRDATTFVLYRGLGIVLILVLAVILTSAVRAADVEFLEGLTQRQLAIAVVLLPILTMALVAVPLNSTTIGVVDPPEDAIEIQDYHVYYAEDVQNERVGAINISFLNETTSVNASGVIVVSESRHLWTEAVGASELAFWGDRSVRVGGVGWRESVNVKREGWMVANESAVYHVYLEPPDGDYTHVYASANSTAGPTIDHRNVTVVPADTEFYLVVSRDAEVIGNTTIPGPGNTTTAGGISFVREADRVFAVRNGTRVAIAKAETYN